MKVGIISDTHNHRENLEHALEILRAAGVELLYHCGDFTSPETARQLSEFRVHHVIGNGDVASGEIREVLLSLNEENTSGLVYTGRLDGLWVAATHGHLRGKLEELVQSGEYDYVLHGHSHRRKNEQVGRTTVINPGALGGLRAGARSFCILDTEARSVKFYETDLLPKR